MVIKNDSGSRPSKRLVLGADSPGRRTGDCGDLADEAQSIAEEFWREDALDVAAIPRERKKLSSGIEGDFKVLSIIFKKSHQIDSDANACEG